MLRGEKGGGRSLFNRDPGQVSRAGKKRIILGGREVLSPLDVERKTGSILEILLWTDKEAALVVWVEATQGRWSTSRGERYQQKEVKKGG